MKEFIINTQGVCTNPNIHFSIGEHNEYFEIRTAEFHGRWASSSHFKSSHHTSTALPGFGEYRESFDTEKEAILDEIKKVIDDIWMPKWLVLALKDYRNTLIFEQLALF